MRARQDFGWESMSATDGPMSRHGSRISSRPRTHRVPSIGDKPPPRIALSGPALGSTSNHPSGNHTSKIYAVRKQKEG